MDASVIGQIGNPFELLREIFPNDNFVVVGGSSLFKRGIKLVLKDIDIVVSDTENLPNLEPDWTNDKDRWAYVYKGRIIDIFLRDNLPDYEVIDNIKYSTIEDERKVYESRIEHIEKLVEVLPKIKESLELIKNR